MSAEPKQKKAKTSTNRLIQTYYKQPHNCSTKDCSGAITERSLNSVGKQLTCGLCYDTWFICEACNLRFNRRKFLIAQEHFLQEHDSTCSLTGEVHNLQETNVLSQSSSDSIPTVSTYDDCDVPVELDDTEFNQSTKDYFLYESQAASKGKQLLVNRAFEQSQKSNALADEEETDMHLKIARFVYMLSGTQQAEFASILQFTQQSRFFKRTRIPVRMKELRHFYTTGKHSIIQNLPVPNICNRSNHAYVTLTSVIEYFLALGFEPDVEHNAISLASSPYARSVRETFCTTNVSPLTLYIIFWSDEFQANGTRKNKHSTWIKTVTFAAPLSKANCSKYTYLLALGSSADAHDHIHKIHFDELKQWSKIQYKYFGKVGKTVPVIVKLLAYSADRPERASINFMLGHSGKYSKRWGYSAYVNQDKLPSCSACLVRRMTILKYGLTASDNAVQCRSCIDWNYNYKGRLLVSLGLPNDYPTEQDVESPEPPESRRVRDIKYLCPMRITYETLKQGCRYAVHNLFVGSWTTSNTYAYLKTMCLSEFYIRHHIVQYVSRAQFMNHSLHTVMKNLWFPAIWSSDLEVWNSIETPMHLLFLGIVKSTIDISFRWLKSLNKHKAFCNLVQPLLNRIRALRSPFCMINDFNGTSENTLGGWISESYLAFARIMGVAYGYITEIDINDEAVEELFQFQIQACLCVISRAMTTSSIKNNELDMYIKIFLTSVDEFEKVSMYNGSRGDMSWFSRANYLSLLNLPRQIKTFGPLRLYWEGSRERFIQEIKPYMKTGRESSTNYEIQLQHIYQEFALNTLCDSSDSDNQSLKEKKSRKYQGVWDIKSVINRGSAFTLVYFPTRTAKMFLVVIRNICQDICLHKVVFDDNKGKCINSMWFTTCNITAQAYKTFASEDEFLAMEFIDCLASPRVFTNDKSIYYNILSEDWRYRNALGELKLPTISMNLIDKLSERANY